MVTRKNWSSDIVDEHQQVDVTLMAGKSDGYIFSLGNLL